MKIKTFGQVDAFVIYTDSETWAGNVAPDAALRAYREQSGIDARLVVVGMVSNGFSIADPTDAGMLDVVGFDTATPQLIADSPAAPTNRSVPRSPGGPRGRRRRRGPWAPPTPLGGRAR